MAINDSSVLRSKDRTEIDYLFIVCINTYSDASRLYTFALPVYPPITKV